MADEKTTTAKPKGYRLAKGAKLDVPRVGIKVSNEDLKNPNIIALLMRKAPELFGTDIVPA